jgi:hypothetical protein
MSKQTSLSPILFSSLALACLLLAWSAPRASARGSDKSQPAISAHFAGQWNFNASQSDDANDKIREAERNARMARGGGGYPRGGGYPGGGYPGGGYPRGGIGVGRGGMGRGAEASAINGEDLETLARDAQTLTIARNGDQFSISDDQGEAHTLYADGKKHKEDDGGRKVTYKTQWDGDRLVSEHKLGSTGKLTETYELSPDGKQLFITSKLESSKLSGPLTIRRVYDNSNAQTKN